MDEDIRFSVILDFMGQTRDRFQTYGPPYTLAESLARAARVRGCTAVEIAHPTHLADFNHARELLSQYNLAVSAVSADLRANPIFNMGALISPDPLVRERAVTLLKEAMDLAPALGVDLVTCCPLADGADYAFQIDYFEAWGRFVEGLRAAASHRPDVRLALEYKPGESRAHGIMGSAMSALHVCDQIGLPNVGVTVDIGHALYGGERPALSIAQVAAAGRLFLVHINDNERGWDWDLVPGSVNWWDWIEVLLYLDRAGYDGWLVSDVMGGRLDAVDVMGHAYKAIRRGRALLRRVDRKRLWSIIGQNDALSAYDQLFAALGLDE